MQLSYNLLHYFISYAVAVAVFGCIGNWYLWPTLKDRAPRAALTRLLHYPTFRIIALMFLTPGLVSLQLPKGFEIAGRANSLSLTATGGVRCAPWS